MDDAFGHWLAGFIDGEGCFMISRRLRQPEVESFACCFQLFQRVDDTETVLMLQSSTGIGSIVHRPKQAIGAPQIGWAVRTKSDALELVHLLDRFPLRAKKREDFAFWREAVLDWNAMRCVSLGHLRGMAPHDWSNIKSLRDQMMEGRRYRPLTQGAHR